MAIDKDPSGKIYHFRHASIGREIVGKGVKRKDSEPAEGGAPLKARECPKKNEQARAQKVTIRRKKAFISLGL